MMQQRRKTRYQPSVVVATPEFGSESNPPAALDLHNQSFHRLISAIIALSSLLSILSSLSTGVTC